MVKSDRKIVAAVLGSFFLVAIGWFLGLAVAPVDRLMGEVYRIIYLHVPAAAAAFLASFLLFVFAVLGLRRQNERYLRLQKAAAEVGLMFTAITLATGSIWGRPTWGTWWTWDARLTTTLILALLYAGFLLLYNALEAGAGRRKACSILGILIFADVPIVYKSVSWWRTLHQPPSLLFAGGSTMSPEIYQPLVYSIAAMAVFSIVLLIARYRVIELRDRLEHLTLKNA